MEDLKNRFLANWNWIRILRLVLGVVMAAQAIMTWNALSGLFAGILLFQAFTNTGCCGVGGCEVPSRKENSESKTDEGIVFEEIK